LLNVLLQIANKLDLSKQKKSSSGSENKLSEKPARRRVSGEFIPLACSYFLKKESTYSSITSTDFKRLHGVISQQIKIILTIAARTSNPACINLFNDIALSIDVR
jgi:hypothetical protein